MEQEWSWTTRLDATNGIDCRLAHLGDDNAFNDHHARFRDRQPFGSLGAGYQ